MNNTSLIIDKSYSILEDLEYLTLYGNLSFKAPYAFWEYLKLIQDNPNKTEDEITRV